MTQGDPQEVAGVRDGQILAGKYRVERVLGVGGMGVVVAATHLQLDTKVALKFLLPTMLGNQEVVGRFAREARAAVKIQSEHVARVLDVGTLENGAPYLVMEFLEGGDLGAWIQRQGPLPIEQAVDFVLQACVGVASAHGIGIVHRDLKPANLFCLRGNDGQFVIKVLDFGISKLTDAGWSPDGLSGTKTASVMGSPFYMSPEQMVSAKDVDAQADIWALGVVLYELLTTARPFSGESLPEIAIKVATAQFAPVERFRSDVPPSLEAVIVKCLEKDKKRRYANVAELALALAGFGSKRSQASVERVVGIIQASGLSIGALAPTPSLGVASALGIGTMTSFEPLLGASGPLGTMAPSATTAPGARRRPKALWMASAIGAGLVAVVLGLLIAAKRQSTTLPISATSTPALAEPSALQAIAPVREPRKLDELSAPNAAAVAPESIGSPALPAAEQATRISGAGHSAHPEPRKASPQSAKSASAAAAPTMPAASAAAAPPQNNAKCNPPYFIDSAGHRQYKPECL